MNAITESKTTVTQDALQDPVAERVEDLKWAAKEKEIRLSLDWIDKAGEDENFLGKAMDDKSEYKVKTAVDLMGSSVTPFVSSATAIGSLFLALLRPPGHDLQGNREGRDRDCRSTVGSPRGVSGPKQAGEEGRPH